MPSAPAISVDKLSKAYRIGLKDDVPDSLMGAVHGMLRAPVKNWRRLARLNTFRHQEDAEDLFWALRDVSFEVQEGEVLGIIGRNGAGKSTLLKILSRITEPTSGRAVIRGRVSSLLEVGTGFHPDLTGRDNVYMNGTILGMTKREIDRKFDEIVDFSGVEKFLDTPIKHYSSGMKVRLAFAVAAHLEPEILIIDEVLAVGDAEFQKKCLGKMQDVARGGRTVLFVSHNMPAVESLCSWAIALEKGQLVNTGSTHNVLQKYRSSALSLAEVASERVFENSQFIERVDLVDDHDQPTNYVSLGATLNLRITIGNLSRLRSPTVGIGFDGIEGQRLLTCLMPKQPMKWKSVNSRCEVICRIHHFPLAPGRYTTKIAIAENGLELEAIEPACCFLVADAAAFDDSRGFHRGVCVAPAKWELRESGDQFKHLVLSDVIEE